MTAEEVEDESLDEIFEEYASFQDRYSEQYIRFDKFLAHYRGDLSPNTLVAYGRSLKYIDFDPLAESPSPECLEEEEQERFDLSQFESLWAKRRMKEICGKSEDSRATRDRQAYLCWLALKKYYKALGYAEKIKELPDSDEFDNKKSSGGGTEDKVRLSEHQVQELMDSADEKMECAIILLYYGGMRSYELLNARHSWLDFTQEEKIECRVPAEHAKGERGNREPEKLYIKKDFQEKLQGYIQKLHNCEEIMYDEFLEEVGEGEYLFSLKEDSEKTFKDLRVERWRLWEKIRELAEKAGLNEDSLSSHDFRGSAIFHVYSSVNDLSRTAKVARHNSSETTEKFYINLDEEEKWNTYREAFDS